MLRAGGGLAVPLLGALAASGLVLYFIAHPRVGSRKIVGGIVFRAAATAALTLGGASTARGGR